MSVTSKIVLPFIITSSLCAENLIRPIIMLDPAGDAKNPGRTIDNSFERAITLQLAEALKTALEQRISCTVLITRAPGETVSLLQNATFANRLSADIYISLNCYHAPQDKLSLALYQFSYGDMQPQKSFAFAMTPYDKAHLAYTNTTQTYANHIRKTFATSYQHLFQIHGVYAVPFKPLIGIQSPAIALEMNCIHEADWKTYFTPLVEALNALVETI